MVFLFFAALERFAGKALEGCLLLSRTGDLEGLKAFQDGLFYVQDPASRLAVMAAVKSSAFV